MLISASHCLKSNFHFNIFLDNGVMTTPKRRILSFIFTVLTLKKSLLIRILKRDNQLHLFRRLEQCSKKQINCNGSIIIIIIIFIIIIIIIIIILSVWYVWMPDVKRNTSARRQDVASFSVYINVFLNFKYC